MYIGERLTARYRRRFRQIFLYEGKQNCVMRRAINRQALPQNAFADGAGPFSDALAGDVIGGGDNFYAVQTKLLKAKPRGEPGCSRSYAATGGTGAHPVTKIRDLMNSIDEVDADSAQESSGRLIKDCEAVPFVALRKDIARGDKIAALLN